MTHAISQRLKYYMCSITIQQLFICMFLIAKSEVMAQSELPVLKANSPNVQILDGSSLSKGDWIIDPATELDVYEAIRSSKKRTITFKTDVESKSFEVEPGRFYDFVILLNGKDTCKTRISTMKQHFEWIGKSPPSMPCTIPISIVHGKLHLQGQINGSKTLDLIFDTGADCCVLYPSGISKGATFKSDSKVLNQGSGGTTMRDISRDNQLDIAGARWQHESVIFVEKQADNADGIVSYSVFEDKALEIDFDRMEMILHDSLPSSAKDFNKTAMPFAGTLPAVEVVMTSEGKSCHGPFILDTAGTGCMLVNEAFGTLHALNDNLKKVGTSVSMGVGSGKIHSNRVIVPTLSIAGHSLANVPINVELPTGSYPSEPGGVVCMDVLTRFNCILDFPNSEAYFKPNTMFAEPFKIRSKGFSFPFVATIVGGCVFAVTVLSFWIRSKRRKSVDPVSK
jgi:hypothetical protein